MRGRLDGTKGMLAAICSAPRALALDPMSIARELELVHGRVQALQVFDIALNVLLLTKPASPRQRQSVDSMSMDEVWAAMESGVLPWYVNEHNETKKRDMVDKV